MNYKRRKNISDKYVSEFETSHAKNKYKKSNFKRFSSFLVVFFIIFAAVGNLAPSFNFTKILKATPVLKYYSAFETFAKKNFSKVSHISRKGADFISGYLNMSEKEDEKVFALETVQTNSKTLQVNSSGEILSDANPAQTHVVKPVFSPSLPCSGNVSSPFGPRIHPITGENSFHSGVDIAGNTGDTVKATEEGEVTSVSYDNYSGNLVVITHSDGYSSLYAHLYDSSVRVGDKVEKGEKIARMGSTGLSTGPHLHFEIRKDNEPQDPLGLIACES